MTRSSGLEQLRWQKLNKHSLFQISTVNFKLILKYFVRKILLLLLKENFWSYKSYNKK